MKLQQLIINKKAIIIALAVFVLMCTVIGIVVTRDKSSKSNTDISTEQSEDDEDVLLNDSDKNTKEDDSEGALESVKDDTGATENRTDASGSWESTESSDNKDDKKQEDEKQEDVKPEEEQKQDILEGDIIYGDIY